YNEAKVSLKPDLYPSAEQKEKVRHLVNRTNLISFAPCSKWYTKQLTIEKSAEIARGLLKAGYSIALLGGPNDTAYCGELESVIKDDELINLCGKTAPLESYEVMTHSRAVITVDSAAQHLAAASGKPVVLVYGSTDMSFGFYPLTSKYAIAENDTLECRPCTDHGRDKCPLGHFKCIVDLDAKRIVSMMEGLVK
ncbi:MAG TPA: glycosyltransferase family 9 protein, partial [Ignavibacteria bacterium]|nr:glycosyltransferase family 9 protein [Ignavibacteria bacterium]